MQRHLSHLPAHSRRHVITRHDASASHSAGRSLGRGVDATASDTSTADQIRFPSTQLSSSINRYNPHTATTANQHYTQTSAYFDRPHPQYPIHSQAPPQATRQQPYLGFSDNTWAQSQQQTSTSQIATQIYPRTPNRQHMGSNESQNNLRPVPSPAMYNDFSMNNFYPSSQPTAIPQSISGQSEEMNTQLGDIGDGTTRMNIDDRSGFTNGRATDKSFGSARSDQGSGYTSRTVQSDNTYPGPKDDPYVFPGSLPTGDPRFLGRSPTGIVLSQPSPVYSNSLLALGPSNTSEASSSNRRSSRSEDSTIPALQCPHCGKYVSRAKDLSHRKSNLARHIRTDHKDVPRVICPEVDCDKSFKRSDALRKHQRHEHGSE